MRVVATLLFAFVASSEATVASAENSEHFLRKLKVADDKKLSRELYMSVNDEIVKDDTLPENCERKNTTTTYPCKPKPPVLPRKCAGVSASWSGDPHFKTFDMLKYDCQGAGEFDVVKSLDSDFSLQGRFIKFDPARRPSVTTSVVFDTGDGEAKIQVNAPKTSENKCMPYVFVDDEPTDTSEFETDESGIFEISDGIYAKATKTDEENGFVFYYKESEVQLKVSVKVSSKNGCVIRADLCIPDCYERRFEKFVGLLGTPDGKISNDWTGRDGKEYDVKKAEISEFEQEFCGTWCIKNEDDSLFAYEENERFEDYENCEESKTPDLDTEKCVADPESVLGDDKVLKICGSDYRECLVDGCIGGKSMAQKYIKSAIKSVDTNCGKELYKETFENDEDLPDEFKQILDKEEGSGDGKGKGVTKYLYLSPDNNKVDFPTIEVPDGSQLVKVEFLLYELGKWENEKENKENLIVIVGDTEVGLGKFTKKEDEKNKKIEGGIWFKRKSITESCDLGFGDVGSKKDEIHKVTVEILPQVFEKYNNKVPFSIKFISKDTDGEGAGIDDVKYISFADECKIDCDGISIIEEDFDDTDESDWGMTSTLPDGRVILGPIKEKEDKLGKTFEVPSYAGKADIDFLLYEIDNTKKTKFFVTIGDKSFNLGEFNDKEENSIEVTGEVQKDKEKKRITWKRSIQADYVDLGFDSESLDRIHMVHISVGPHYFKDGFLPIEFSTNKIKKNEKWAVDDFSIEVFPDPEECKDDESEAKDNSGTGECPTQEEQLLDGEICEKITTEVVCSPTAAPEPGTPTQAPTKPPSPDDKSFTPAPTSAPTAPPVFTTGDPHIKTWSGKSYDFHGECDVVLIHNPDFNNGQGMFIHVRTKIQRWWSYIESAVIRIGDDTLEIKSGIEDRRYWVNGKEGPFLDTSQMFGFTIGGFSGRFRQLSDTVVQYKLFLPDDQIVFVRSVKNMLRVEVDGGEEKDFGNSLGLMGTYGDGILMGRDEVTVMNDYNEFGQEWQVHPTDPQLFHSPSGPQYPEKCRMPTTSQTKRRLASSISKGDAERACSHVNKSDFANCVFDVMAMDDVDAAEGY